MPAIVNIKVYETLTQEEPIFLVIEFLLIPGSQIFGPILACPFLLWESGLPVSVLPTGEAELYTQFSLKRQDIRDN